MQNGAVNGAVNNLKNINSSILIIYAVMGSPARTTTLFTITLLNCL